eukprot:TRINITY_DN828_c0_g3_i5.p2 TRINITY_DN828_c0_g3~~TRINITY_DN828_c0_g3_i5.p2  ORF type:complete len:184 (-),score=10.15 TRINITY_DN828_c0_g3_i5:477-1028(-)
MFVLLFVPAKMKLYSVQQISKQKYLIRTLILNKMKCDIVSVLLFTSFLAGCVSGGCFESESGNFLSADSGWVVSSSRTCGNMEQWLYCDYGPGEYYGIWHVESSFSPVPASDPHVFLTATSTSRLQLIEVSKFVIGNNQKWVPIDQKDGYVAYQNKDSGKYLTAGNGFAGLSDTIGPDQKFRK